jgi:glycosyltransferase involved in cell wall biosynthesis
MRLAVFTSQFPGRVNTFFARDMRALLEAGCEIDIFAFYPLDPTLWQYVPGILGEDVFPRNRLHHITVAKGLRELSPLSSLRWGTLVGDTAGISASALRFGPVPLFKSGYVIMKALLWSQRHGDGYDHVLAYWGNYAATCAYVFHRLVGRENPFSMFLHAGMDLYRNQVYLRQKLLYADNIIVVCEFNRHFIRGLYPDVFPMISNKIHVHHLGLNLDEFVFQPNGRPLGRIVSVGRLDKHKGFNYLLHATRELVERGLDIEVELVGSGEQEAPLRRLARDLGIGERVGISGWLPFDEVRQKMSQATILVHPSRGLGDAVPTVIKESIALGTPVVASNVAGIPELLDEGRCGILVPPRDVGALAGAIERLLQSEPLRRKYAMAARRYAEEKFDLWRNGKRLAEILDSTRRARAGDSVRADP